MSCPRGFLLWTQQPAISSLGQDMAMRTDLRPSRGDLSWMADNNDRRPRAGVVNAILLPALAIAGLLTWTMLSGPSGAEGQLDPARSPTSASTQNMSRFDPVATATPAEPAVSGELAVPAEPAVVETAPVQGVRISSQSFRRGGLGSKALMTFTLRNSNEYAITDIEIACSFTRRDGSHLTDRKRMIHDTVNMKSRKTFTRLHIGFVNINANQAKCLPVTASRI